MKSLFDGEHWKFEVRSRKAYLWGTCSVWLAFIMMGFARACGWAWLDVAAMVVLASSTWQMLVFYRVTKKQLARMSARTDELLAEEVAKLEGRGHEPLT